MLNKIGAALSLKTDLASLLDMIVFEAKNLTNADGETLYMLNHKTNELDFTVVRNKSLDDEEINFAALMHDVDKLTTTDYILEKATKLSSLYDWVEVIKIRALMIKKEIEIEFLKSNISKDKHEKDVKKIEEALDLLIRSNIGSESMSDEVVKTI